MNIMKFKKLLKLLKDDSNNSKAAKNNLIRSAKALIGPCQVAKILKELENIKK